MNNTEKNLKDITLIGLILISGFVLTNSTSFFISRTSMRNVFYKYKLPLTAENIHSEISKDFQFPIHISSFMANDHFLKNWIIKGERDSSEIITYLKKIKKRYNMFTCFFVSENSHIYYQANKILKKVSPDEIQDEWYFRVKEMNESYEINIDADLANKDAMTIFINYRVCDENGRFIGATGVGLARKSILKVINTFEERYNCRIYFLNDKGDIEFSDSKTVPAVVTEFINNYQSSIMKNRDGVNSFSYREKKNTIYYNIFYVKELKKYLVIEQDDVELMDEILKIVLFNFLLSTVVILIVLFTVYRSQKHRYYLFKK